MKTETQNKLAVVSAVKPPPTKTEVIESMALLLIEKRKKEEKDREAKKAELKEKIVALARKECKKLLVNCPVHFNAYYYNASGPTLDFTLNLSRPHFSPAMLALLTAYKAVQDRMTVPSLGNARKEVRDAMLGVNDKETRVSAILADKDSRDLLQKALDKLIV